MLSQVARYYHTLRYLQWIQIRYRLLYQIRKGGLKIKRDLPAAATALSTKSLKLTASVESHCLWLGKDSFQFLNIQHQFEDGINWNNSQHGKLWTYNLNYFEFLSQPALSKYEGLGLMHDFINKESTIKDGLEPFPISLRVLFWIKFIIQHQIKDAQIDRSLFRQLQQLSVNLEYHLLGNHLLENGFSLLFGAFYFGNTPLLEQAKAILLPQLNEQVLADGGHFELSPMYHQLMLYRILDSINLLQHNPSPSTADLLKLFQQKAEIMLGWMEQMTFSNGDMPLVNDSAPGIAPNRDQLLDYANRLELSSTIKALKESGYRKFLKDNYEILIDVGRIGPDYIPGHAHSDTFNFILHHQSRPFIIDTGISTYEKNERRNLERSTQSHNTVMINEQEQSEVWGGFRVARRAKILDLQESENQIQATHDGYQRINALHQRTFILGDQSIAIKDEITEGKTGQAFFHFHPDISVQLIDGEIKGSFGKIQFNPSTKISLSPYIVALGFNQTREAIKATVTFKENLHTKIALS